ncbi:MAG: MBOAT family protein, partial [Exiguobacterium chiriqhucha]
MLFSSTVFLFYFLPIVLGLYFISPRPIKNTILLVASLFFYAWGEPRFVLIMLASIAMNYVFGLLVDRDRHHEKKIKLWMTLMVLGNLGMLGVFKYAS